MSDWRATLERAATLSKDAVRHLPGLVRLLESVAAGRATVDDVRDELGTIVDRRPGFVDALDAALRFGCHDQPGFDAARAVLFELPRVLDAIVAIPPLGPEPNTEGGAAATLARMHALERSGSGAKPHSTFVCPRCRSRRIKTQHTDAFERREMEVRCAECGNYGAWTEGDAEEAEWHPMLAFASSTTRSTKLTDTFIEYLKTGAARPHELAATLRAAVIQLEGTLLERSGWQAGIDGWRRIFVGRKPPSDAVPGDAWLDSVEVMPMVLVEAPTYRADSPTRLVWLAIRPVMRWQFRAFAAVAPIVGRTVQVELPIKPLDSARLVGDELAPITSITEGEAGLYALWFGKAPGTRNAWRGATQVLGDRAASLWTPGLREWTCERCSFDEGLRVRIGPDDVELNADDDYIAMMREDAELRTLVGEAAHEPTTGMRTAVGTTLTDVVSYTFCDFESITLDCVYPR
ncbi:MAG: hypothetical protein ACKVX7_10960 [Planctomycetota bacterium]